MFSLASQELQASPKVVVLDHRAEDSRAEISLGSDSIQVNGLSHNSIGLFFKVECDTAAFAVDSKMSYMNPESMERGERGGDAMTVTYTLTPKKKGIFTVYTVVNLSGMEESRTKHTITIK